MKLVKHICRVALGLVFIFSGFVKGIDPLGSSYKFTDYFNSFGWGFMLPLAMALGILLAAAEFAIGVALIFKLYMRTTAWLSLLFMSFFTALTFYIALKNPVSDCGCFGDALKLTNWQTFYKNLVLIALAIWVFAERKKFRNEKGMILPIISFTSTMIVYAILIFYSYNHLPLIDFLPYKVGVNIPDGMKTPDGAAKDVYETTFRYKNKKTGEIQKFTDANYPWRDSLNWEFVAMDGSKLIKQGYKPPIHDFIMQAENGDDVKDFFLYDEGYTFVLVAYNLQKTDRKNVEDIKQLAKFATEYNLKFVGMTASVRDEINQFKAETGLEFDFLNCDEITLKSMIRSNPGLILMKKGTILAKWHSNDIPDGEDIQKQFGIHLAEVPKH